MVSSMMPPFSLVKTDSVAAPDLSACTSATTSFSIKSTRSFPCSLFSHSFQDPFFGGGGGGGKGFGGNHKRAYLNWSMCDTSKSEAALRVYRCESITERSGYCSGMSQPAKPTI